MKTIVWDVDDVLNDLMREWFEQAWMPAHPGCTVAYADISENPPHQVLQVPLAEYLQSLDAFRERSIPGLFPVPEVRAWFERHGERFRHVALTAVPLCAAHLSAEWVIRHYGTWMRSFNFVPSLRDDKVLPGYDQTKSDFLRWLDRADVFVDDSQANVQGARDLGIQALLMPRPWNSSGMTVAATLEQLSGLKG